MAHIARPSMAGYSANDDLFSQIGLQRFLPRSRGDAQELLVLRGVEGGELGPLGFESRETVAQGTFNRAGLELGSQLRREVQSGLSVGLPGAGAAVAEV